MALSVMQTYALLYCAGEEHRAETPAAFSQMHLPGAGEKEARAWLDAGGMVPGSLAFAVGAA
jgi:hypothetical protein